MKDLLENLLAFIIFIIICMLITGVFIMILKFVAWLLSIEWIRNIILILCFIGTATMLYEEFRKEE